MVFNVMALTAAWAFLIYFGATGFGETSLLEPFPRTGAVMTVISAISEYHLAMSKSFSWDGKRGTSSADVANSIRLNEKEIRIKGYSHLSFIVGSLIWAFGDLIYITNQG